MRALKVGDRRDPLRGPAPRVEVAAKSESWDRGRPCFADDARRTGSPILSKGLELSANRR